jgi:hypothetical protein
MPEATAHSDDICRNIPFAVSLLDDWSSFNTRLGAAKFLGSNPGFDDTAIVRIWDCIYTEKRPEVVAELLTILGTIGERAADSVPLIAYHLDSKNSQVVEAATQALCSLSGSIEHALAPLLTADLHGRAHTIREQVLSQAAHVADPVISRYTEQLRWIHNTPRHARVSWLNELPRVGLSELPEADLARFLLLYANPTGEHVWGCLKVIWQSQKVAPHATTQQIERALSACEGSFFREVTSYGEPIRARFLARALAHSRPFTASLAYPLANVELDGTEAQVVSLRIKATAVQLAPQTPPHSSLQQVLEALWYESEDALRASAIDCLIDLLPDLGEGSAHEVIDDVFEFMRHPVIRRKNGKSSVMREVASIITVANRRDLEYVLQKTESILADNCSEAAKRCALRNLPHLQYAGEHDPLAVRAKAILERESLSDEPKTSTVATTALRQLLVRERHRAGQPNDIA